ncbi:hypothetical protein DL765_004724 [Monosporascus sp. GIB2]|nr:hypothetical protein DL765_004724 [Monosporascus sp. GIB2]
MQRPQEFIGISYAGRGIYIKKPDTWDGLIRVVSQRFQLPYATAASLRVMYSSDMSGTSPRWEVDASACVAVKPDSSIYLEIKESVEEETQGTGPSDENSGRLAAKTDAHDPTEVVLNVIRPVGSYKVRVSRTMTIEKFMLLSADNSTTTVSWTVSVEPDGTLTQHGTGRQSSYLFWEARGLLSSTSRLLSSGEHDSAFDPSNPTVFFERWHANITLPFDCFEPYLDSVLQSLTLTPAMRTEFIVYWLPSFHRIRDRGQDIRFTLVPQEAFNKAAELRVEGAVPKAVARVFMLFGGVEKKESSDPYADYQTSAEDARDIDWPGVIGLDIRGMKDEAAFRVLEWGGMEVPTVSY